MVEGKGFAYCKIIDGSFKVRRTVTMTVLLSPAVVFDETDDERLGDLFRAVLGQLRPNAQLNDMMYEPLLQSGICHVFLLCT